MRALLAIWIVCIAGVAAAHPLDTGYLRVESRGSDLAITFDLDAAVAAQELRVEAGAVDQALATRARELAATLYRTAAPMVGDQACTWGPVTGTRKGTTVTLVDTAACPAGAVRWDLSFVRRLGATYQILGKTRDGEVETVITIDKATTQLTMARASGAALTDSIWTGIEHVGLLPRAWHGLPQGLECLALALLLLLGGGGLRGQLTRAWMLVVGHAIGLTAVSMIPALAPIAPYLLIASIAAAAVSIATGKLERHRWLLATIAGGAHGAATLASAGHPFGFVAGFAIAQLAIAVVIGPLLGMLTAPEDLAKKLLPPIAVALGGLAIYGVVRWL